MTYDYGSMGWYVYVIVKFLIKGSSDYIENP